MENKENVLMQGYIFGKLLGQGNFAKVYRGRNIKSGQNVAIKVIGKEKIFKFELINQVKREISVMKLIEHPNVVQLYEVMASKTRIYLVMEYARGGELFKKLAKKRLKEDIARKYFQQLIAAVDFCHSKGVYHRDLKPENLLIDGSGNIKVSDFGLSAVAKCRREDGLLHTTCGTPDYVSPEVINRKGYDGAKSDIWSCGVILFVLLAGYLPFRDSNLMEMYKKIFNSDYKCPCWFPTEARGLLSRILDPNPLTRISIAGIMEHPWFRKGLHSKHIRHKVEAKEMDLVVNVSAMCDTCEAISEMTKPSSLNAFDIISMSAGFDLSGLFVDNEIKEDVQFTSAHPAPTIIAKLMGMASRLELRVKRKAEGGGWWLRMEGSKNESVSIDVEIYEIAPSITHLVRLKISGADAFEYLKVLKQEIRPAAVKEEGITSAAWQGEQQPLDY